MPIYSDDESLSPAGALPASRGISTRSPAELTQLARDEAASLGVDPDLAARMVHQESRGRADAVSPKGAFGPAQLMPGTAADLERRYGGNARDPGDNVRLGVRYLKEQLVTFGNDPVLASAAYNAGPGAVQKYGGVPPYKETRDYVQKVARNGIPVSQRAAQIIDRQATPEPKQESWNGYDDWELAEPTRLSGASDGFTKGENATSQQEDTGSEWQHQKDNLAIAWNGLQSAMDGHVAAGLGELISAREGRPLSPRDAAEDANNRQAFRETMAKIDARQRENADRLSRARPATQKFMSAAGGEWDMATAAKIGDALIRNPIGVTSDVIVQSSLPSLAGMATAVLARYAGGSATAGALAGGLGGSAFMEFGNAYAENRAEGLPHEQAWAKAGAKASVIGTLDAMSFQTAGHALEGVLSKASLAQKTGIVGKEVGRQAFLGAAGEAGGSLAAGQKPDPVAVVSEAIAEVGGAPGEALSTFRRQSEVADRPDQIITPATGAVPAGELLEQPAPDAAVPPVDAAAAALEADPTPVAPSRALDLALGAPTQFQTESGVTLDGDYALVDADQLIASHDTNLRPNPLFHVELQPRRRERAASELQISSIVQRLNPERLGASPDVANGAPIIGADGLVESGNARTIALQRTYEADGEQAQQYRDWLKANAAAFGITPESVDSLQKPVLVRVRNTPVNRAEFARQANASTVAAMSPTEQAASDVARIGHLDDLHLTEDGDLTGADNRGFVNRFVGGLSPGEQAGLLDAGGRLSQAGVTRIRNAVMARAYGNSPTLMRMVESADANLRNLTNALTRVAPQVAKAREAIDAGALHDADLTADLLAAVEELAKIKEDGRSVDEAMAQMELGGQSLSDETRDLIRFLDQNIRAPRRVAAFISDYFDALSAFGNPQQQSLLDAGPIPDMRSLIAQVKERSHATEDSPAPAGPAAQPGATPEPQPGSAPSGTQGPAEAETSEWVAFPADSGTLGIPRAEMPQVKSADRGALVQFLKGRGITHQKVEVDPHTLRPTQAEFSLKKTAKWSEVREGTDRSILISSDGYVLDGHHQWVAALVTGEQEDAIRFDAPIRELLAAVFEFPSVKRSEGGTNVIDLAAVREQREAVAEQDFQAALADLGTWVRENMTGTFRMVPEDTPELLATLGRLFDAAIRKGYHRFSKAVTHVMAALRRDKTTAPLANAVKPQMLQRAFDEALKRYTANVDHDGAQEDLFAEPKVGSSGDLFASEQASSSVPKVTQQAPKSVPTQATGKDSLPVGASPPNFIDWIKQQGDTWPVRGERLEKLRDQYAAAYPQQITRKNGRALHAQIDGRDYDMARDNYKPPLPPEFMTPEQLAQAQAFVDKYYKEPGPAAISAEQRQQAEAALAPLMKLAEDAKVEYDQKIIDITRRTKALGQMLAPLKSLSRAAEKVALDYAGDASQIKDLLRSTIVVRSYAEAPAVIDEIRANFEIVAIKDKTSAEARERNGGYADQIVFVRMRNGAAAEIQINMPAMLSMKEHLGHRLYEAARAVSKVLAKPIYAAMRTLYDLAFSFDGGASLKVIPPRGAPALPGASPVGSNSEASSENLNHLPSGNMTNSSPEKVGTNRQPSGNLPGTGLDSIASTSAPIMPETNNDGKEAADERGRNSGKAGKGDKVNAQASKLREAGLKLSQEAEADYGRDRNTNTRRRASMAASAEADAAQRKVIGDTMLKLADALEAGSAPELAGVTTRAQIELLDHLLTRAKYARDRKETQSYADAEKRKGRAFEPADLSYVEFQRASWLSGAKSALIGAIKGKKGSVKLVPEILRASTYSSDLHSKLKALLSEDAIKSHAGWYAVESVAREGRLERAGITTQEQLREAIRRYSELRAEKMKPDAIKQAERALIGQKVGIDFFPTPKPVAARMVKMAGIEPGMKVLEPSAGNGNIAEAIKDAGVDPDVAELSARLREVLKAKGFNLVANDFAELALEDLPDGDGYDRIVMNPPFSNNQDIEHVRHAYSLLKPGGRIVAIVGEGAFSRRGKTEHGFRDWLDSVGAEVEALPPGSFTDKSLLATTGANARLVVLDKADRDAPVMSRGSDTWYRSTLRDAFQNAKQDSMPSLQWRTWLIANAAKLGVKQDEIQWSGILDYLQLTGGKVSKAQIDAFLADNGVKVDETVLSNEPIQGNGWGSLEGGAKFGEYTLPGGTNYREVLLTLPASNRGKPEPLTALPDGYDLIQDKSQPANRQWGVTLPGQVHARPMGDRHATPELAKAEALALVNNERLSDWAYERNKAEFKSSHWNESNVIAHIRVNDRTDADGNKVLFVEEIQSDWGQKGKKSGFGPQQAGIVEQQESGDWAVRWPDGNFSGGFSREGAERAAAMGRRGENIPNAPFVTKTEAWLALAIKRVIAMAAEGGYDKVAFVNGEQSADRYDLSNQVDSILYFKNDDGTFALSAIVGGSGNMIGESLSESSLEDHVGKEIAKKIVNGEGNRVQVQGKYGYMNELRGIDLKVGGEGMRAFYDKIVPQVANDVLKKLGGGKLETVGIGNVRDNRTAVVQNADRSYSILDLNANVGSANERTGRFDTRQEAEADRLRRAQGRQPGFTITDAIRDKANQGLPLFARGGTRGPGIDLAEVRALAQTVRAGLANAAAIDVVETPEQLPANLLAHVRKNNALADVHAIFDPQTQTIHLVSGNLGSMDEAEAAIFHDLFGHYGLRGIIGDAYTRTMRQIAAHNANVRREASAIRARYGYGELLAIEEALAERARAGETVRMLDRVVTELTAGLRRIGLTRMADFVERMTDAEVRVLLGRAREFVRGGNRNANNLGPEMAMSRGDVTYTPAFRAWFGQSVVTDNGKPMSEGGKPRVVYHGTNDDISVFKQGLTADGGFHFGTSTQANMRSSGGGKNMMPVYLKADSPQRSKDLGGKWKAKIAAAKSAGKDGIVYLNRYEGMTSEVISRLFKNGLLEKLDGMSDAEFRRAVPEAEDSYIVFRPEQIKSATGNSGDFDPTNPSIVMARAGQAPANASPTQRADAFLAQQSRRIAPLEAVLAAPFKLTRLDRVLAGTSDRLLQALGHLVPEAVKQGVVADYKNPQAVIDRRQAMRGAQSRLLRETGDLLNRLSTLTRGEARVAYEWMNSQDPQSAEWFRLQLPEESLRVLAEIEKLIDRLSKEAVALGQLSAEAFARNRFAYLHRSYVKYTAELDPQEVAALQRAIAVFGDRYMGRGMFEAVPMAKIENIAPAWWKRKLQTGKADTALKGEKFIRLERRKTVGVGVAPLPGVGPAQQSRLLEVKYFPAGETLPTAYLSWDQAGTWEVRDVKGKDAVMWRDFSKAEREQMGEIDEVRFAVAKTLHGMIHDVEAGKFLQWIAENYAKKTEADLPKGAIIEQAAESMLRVLNPDAWVQVPDSEIPKSGGVKRYGVLGGRFVPVPIWNDIRQSTGRQRPIGGPLWGAILRAWKGSKTALSPAVHMNNVAANVVMADWADVGVIDLAEALSVIVKAGKDPAMREILNRFEDAGGKGGTFAVSELQREQLEPLLEALRLEYRTAGQATGMVGIQAALGLLFRRQWKAAYEAGSTSLPARATRAAANAMIDLYQSEDVVFRLAKWIKEKRGGASDEQAAKAARDSFLNYEINAPWIQAMRQSAFPFVAFTYRAAPMLLHIATHKPWKILKLGLVYGALNALGYALSGGDEDKERKLLPEEKAGRLWGVGPPKLVRMGWNDAHDQPVFLDVRRWIPVGDIVDLGQTHGAVPIVPFLVPSGPLALLGELVANKSQFTGREIVKRTDTAGEVAGKVLDHVYKSFAPNLPMLPGTYSFDSLVNAGGGKTDPFGRELSLPQAAASAIGIKLASYPPDVMLRQLSGKRVGEMREIEDNVAALTRDMIRKGISVDTYNDKVADQRKKMEKINQRYFERVR